MLHPPQKAAVLTPPEFEKEQCREVDIELRSWQVLEIELNQSQFREMCCRLPVQVLKGTKFCSSKPRGSVYTLDSHGGCFIALLHHLIEERDLGVRVKRKTFRVLATLVQLDDVDSKLHAQRPSFGLGVQAAEASRIPLRSPEINVCGQDGYFQIRLIEEPVLQQVCSESIGTAASIESELS
jgi:hypothetical protein